MQRGQRKRMWVQPRSFSPSVAVRFVDLHPYPLRFPYPYDSTRLTTSWENHSAPGSRSGPYTLTAHSHRRRHPPTDRTTDRPHSYLTTTLKRELEKGHLAASLSLSLSTTVTGDVGGGTAGGEKQAGRQPHRATTTETGRHGRGRLPRRGGERQPGGGGGERTRGREHLGRRHVSKTMVV